MGFEVDSSQAKPRASERHVPADQAEVVERGESARPAVSSPRVSVVIPAYNAARTLPAALGSVLEQTLADYEIIVVDDGSTDDTVALLAGYGERVRVVSKENEGKPAAARNRGVAVARGEFIAFLDADDQWRSDKLEKQVELMAANARLGICFTAAEIIDTDGNRLQVNRCNPKARGDVYGLLSIRNVMVGSSVMVRRVALEGVGGYDESLTSIENWDLWIRIAKDWQVDFVDEPLTSYRQHDGNRSVNVELRRRNIFKILARHHDPDDPTPEGRRRRTEAYFNAYFLVLGIGYFGQLEMGKARAAFFHAMRLKPSRDVFVHLMLSCLGKRGFLMLRSVRRTLRGRPGDDG